MTTAEIVQLATQYRRDLHQIPELDNQLTQTCAYVKAVLSELPCTVTEPIPGSVCAFFDFHRPETTAYRADMDALPVVEMVDKPWKSRHLGCMHACGHDGHTAMALTLARLVAESGAAWPHNVLFVFQPAEETTGGARQIVDSGIFAEHHVMRIFGFHLWPDLPFGHIGSRPGPLFAKSSEVNVDIDGRSTHIARAKDGADALEAGVQFIAQAYRMIDEEVPAEEPKLLKFGMMHSGTVRNALSAHTEIRGSLRSFSPDVFEFMKRRLFEIAERISTATGAQIRLHLNEGYPPVLNDARLYERVQSALGDRLTLLDAPSMTAEDFSFYQQAVPGVFLCLGTGGEWPLHSDRFDFDERVLAIGVEAAVSLLRME